MYIGQDTEYFLFDTDAKKVVPAHTCGFGTQEEEKKKGSNYYGMGFRDGYALEVNSPPSLCRAGVWEQQAWTIEVLQKSRLPKNITLISDPHAEIDLEDIKNGPEDLHRLGCNPTYDPYKKLVKEVDVDPLTLGFRTTGAHLHMSPTPDTLDHLGTLAKYSDLLIGLPFTVIFGDDKEFARRALYGGAGEFRRQKYSAATPGLEYRVLSSRLYHHPAIFGLFIAIWKYTIGQNCKLLMEAGWNDALDEPLQKAINTGQGAEELLSEMCAAMQKFGQKSSASWYVPKDWGAAFLKLRDMRKAGEFDDLLIKSHKSAHWGWCEANTGKSNWSTIGATAPVGWKGAWNL